ncbi:jg6205 [Pararge aegeria aegeria]|uniref:Jg6205 protein n=1 Tax=Pararge aegeria aegeria TaxID=348720 RepID=A0A8S4RNL9_9NEOP|nr:jg6205 [Pararge aegeria aegeria]
MAKACIRKDLKGCPSFICLLRSTVGLPRCWNGSPELVSAALVGPQRGGQTRLSASQVAAGSKRLRTLEVGTPYKRPMSSSGRLSVDVMMMMMMKQI